MAKKNDSKPLETPDYEKFTTIDEVEAEIQRHKDILVHKDRLEAQLEQSKRDYVKAANEDLKVVAEERDHEMGILGALDDRRKFLAKVIPMKSIGN